jgi:glycosyltransferase involved in cell wall biosynthesis
MNPIVSVVIPLFNKEKSICRTIKSVLDQSEQNFELIIVDDGSTDNSVSNIESLKLGDKLRLIHQNNTGQSAARNRGVKEAKTELVAFLDADDEWKPQFLETILELRSQFPGAGAYASSYYFEKQNGKLRLPISQNIYEDGWKGEIQNYLEILCLVQEDFPFNTSSIAVTKRAFWGAGGFPIGVGFGEDIDTWIRLSFTSKIFFINKPLAVYHLGAENRVCKAGRDILEVIYPIKHLSQLLRSGGVPERLRQSAREYIENWLLDLAKEHLKLGKNRQARKLIMSAPVTKKFEKTRYLLLFCAYIPSSICLSMLELRRSLLNILPGR